MNKSKVASKTRKSKAVAAVKTSTPTKTASEVDSIAAVECLREFKKAVIQGDRSSAIMGRLLHEADSQSYYMEKSWGQYPDIYEWAAATHKMSRKRVASLLKTWRFCKNHDLVTDVEMGKIHWTTLRRLAESKVVNDSNVDKWLKDAESLTYEQLNEALRAAKGPK